MSKNKKNILVGLPSYNEGLVLENFLKKLIEKSKKLNFDIVLCDDCSTDNTKNICKRLKINYLKHIINRGVGGARKTILEYSKKENYDYLVFMDSDGQHSLDDLENLLNYKKDFDLIIGKRNLLSKNMPSLSKISNFFGRLVVFFISNKWVLDSQSGFKILNKKMIQKINLNFDRYESDSEFVFEAVKNNLKIKEIEIEVVYNSHSKKKLNRQKWYNGFFMVSKYLFR